MSVYSDKEVSPDCLLPGQWIKEREINMFRVLLIHDARNVVFSFRLLVKRKNLTHRRLNSTRADWHRGRTGHRVKRPVTGSRTFKEGTWHPVEKSAKFEPGVLVRRQKDEGRTRASFKSRIMRYEKFRPLRKAKLTTLGCRAIFPFVNKRCHFRNT